MPKEEWGVKRLCPVTGKRFYDLNRTPIISPYTGEIVPTETPGSKSAGPVAAEKKQVKRPEPEPDEDILVDDDDSVDVDDDLLEDDDDSVAFDDLADVAESDDDT